MKIESRSKRAEAQLNGGWSFMGGRTSKIHSEPTGGDGSQLYVICAVAVNVLSRCRPLKRLGARTSSSMLIQNM